MAIKTIFVGIILLIFTLSWTLRAQDITNSPTWTSLDKPARQSSTYKHAVAGRAVDGNMNTDPSNHTCTLTDPADRFPWWQLDLGAVYYIESVLIYNTKEDADRMKTYRVQMKETAEGYWKDCELKFDTPRDNDITHIYCEEISRYINVKKNSPSLSLCEVQVFTAPLYIKESAYTKATQSSTEGKAIASRAIDYKVNLDPDHCTMTKLEKDPWWKVDISDYYHVGHVVLYMPDTDAARLGPPFRIEVASADGFYRTCAIVEKAAHDGEIMPIECNDDARFFRIAKRGMSTLSVCEVRIFGNIVT